MEELYEIILNKHNYVALNLILVNSKIQIKYFPNEQFQYPISINYRNLFIYLLSLISFYVPRLPSRYVLTLFNLPLVRTNYFENSISIRLREDANQLYNDMDFVGLSLNDFIINLKYVCII